MFLYVFFFSSYNTQTGPRGSDAILLLLVMSYLAIANLAVHIAIVNANNVFTVLISNVSIGNKHIMCV